MYVPQDTSKFLICKNNPDDLTPMPECNWKSSIECTYYHYQSESIENKATMIKRLSLELKKGFSEEEDNLM